MVRWMTPREIIMHAISTPPHVDTVLMGYGPLCARIEQALDAAGYVIVPRKHTVEKNELQVVVRTDIPQDEMWVHPVMYEKLTRRLEGA